jgi:hypothetical protein
MTGKKSDWLAEEIEGLRSLRDEVKLQLHLGKAEARDSFEQLEKRFEHLEGRARSLRDATRADRDQIREAARLLAGEIRKGYEHLKRLL